MVIVLIDDLGFGVPSSFGGPIAMPTLDKLAQGGLRYNDISSDVKVSGPLAMRKASGSASWVDPLVGMIYTHKFNDTWSMNLRGDIGGFGVGSDFAWQGLASVRWQATPTVGVVGAYRYIDMDYEDGNGNKRFLYDMAISGPALGVVFSF